jgi:hypothetical protein
LDGIGYTGRAEVRIRVIKWRSQRSARELEEIITYLDLDSSFMKGWTISMRRFVHESGILDTPYVDELWHC